MIRSNTPIEKVLAESSMEFHNTTRFNRSDFNSTVGIVVESSEIQDVKACTIKESYLVTFTLLTEEWLQFDRLKFMLSIIKQGAMVQFIRQGDTTENKVDIIYRVTIIFKGE